MSRSMQIATRIIAVTLASMLSLAAATSASAAADVPPPPAKSPAAATPQPVQQLDELAEVWVRGKRLSEVIAKAEDEFFSAYNKVNRNHSYDVHCGEVLLSRVSLAMTRTCLPGFYVYNYLDLWGQAVPLCSATNTNSIVDVDGNSYNTAANSTGCTYAPQVPPELMAMEHREKYRRNVLQVVNSNEQLQAMASKLAGLYGEMEAVQNHYVKIRGPEQSVLPVRNERRKSTRAPSNARGGPHTL